MPHSYTKYHENSEWDSKEKKQYRKKAIVEPFKKYFKRKSIPPNKQYWTMCGAHFHIDKSKSKKKIIPLDGEFKDLLQKGLFKASQFFGVDRENSIIRKNKRLYPEATWIHSDFLLAMKDACIDGNFYPIIINYDGVMEKKFGSMYLADILSFIDDNYHGALLLSANFQLGSPYRKKVADKGSDIIDALEAHGYEPPDHWVIDREYYGYPGSSKGHSNEMGTLLFIKTAHRGKPKSTRGREWLLQS